MKVVKEKQVTIDFAFITVVTIKNIQDGYAFTRENIRVKRPIGGEILEKKYYSIYGKHLDIKFSLIIQTGGLSKGIPIKNIKKLNGKPLILYNR